MQNCNCQVWLRTPSAIRRKISICRALRFANVQKALLKQKMWKYYILLEKRKKKIHKNSNALCDRWRKRCWKSSEKQKMFRKGTIENHEKAMHYGAWGERWSACQAGVKPVRMDLLIKRLCCFSFFVTNASHGLKRIAMTCILKCFCNVFANFTFTDIHGQLLISSSSFQEVENRTRFHTAVENTFTREQTSDAIWKSARTCGRIASGPWTGRATRRTSPSRGSGSSCVFSK